MLLAALYSWCYCCNCVHACSHIKPGPATNTLLVIVCLFCLLLNAHQTIHSGIYIVIYLYSGVVEIHTNIAYIRKSLCRKKNFGFFYTVRRAVVCSCFAAYASVLPYNSIRLSYSIQKLCYFSLLSTSNVVAHTRPIFFICFHFVVRTHALCMSAKRGK